MMKVVRLTQYNVVTLFPLVTINQQAVIFPSLVDNSPNALAEVMAVGIPCVATKVGGIPSMIERSISGMLMDKGNINQLTETIDLLDNERIGLNAFEKAISRNHPSKVSQTYMDTYKSLLP